jgi:hypothetical protein
LWREGAVVPASGLGVDNDLYLNTATSDVYQKQSGAWALVANIKGAQGASYDPNTTILSLPYDISMFVYGNMDAASTTVAEFVAPRKISLKQNLTGSLAYAKSAPSNSVSYAINVNGVNKGSVNFGIGSTIGTFTWATGLNLLVGDLLEIVTPASVEPAIANVTICLVGVAQAPNTAMLP